MKHDLLNRVTEWCGWTIDDTQSQLLLRYEEWLVNEAIPAGGLSRHDKERVRERHVGDSLLFSAPLTQTPEEIWDLGSGVGLPGIPLSILFPGTSVTLVDRSEKRCDLAERAVRVLGLANVQVLQGNIHELSGQTEVIVSRATMSPSRLRELVSPHLCPDGVAILGGSWEKKPAVVDWQVIEVPSKVLDHTVWVLMMRPQ